MIKRLFIPFIFIFFSCEREIIVDQVNQEQELVVNALIDPEGMDSLLLSSTYITKSEGVSGASVVVTHNGDTIGRYFEESKGLYRYEGETFQEKMDYDLKIQHPDYPSVSASTTVPVAPELSLGAYPVSGEKVKKIPEGDIQVLLEFEDEKNENNYYMITAASIYNHIFKVGFPEERDSVVTYSDLARINSKSSIIEMIYHGTSYQFAQNSIDWESGYFVCEYELYFTDKLFNGQKVSIPLDIFLCGQRDVSRVLHLTLTSVSEEYYQMLRSISAYEKSREGFFPEALQLYSNVHNGFGVWAAKSSRTISLDISEFDLLNY